MCTHAKTAVGPTRESVVPAPGTGAGGAIAGEASGTLPWPLTPIGSIGVFTTLPGKGTKKRCRIPVYFNLQPIAACLKGPYAGTFF